MMVVFGRARDFPVPAGTRTRACKTRSDDFGLQTLRFPRTPSPCSIQDALIVMEAIN